MKVLSFYHRIKTCKEFRDTTLEKMKKKAMK